MASTLDGFQLVLARIQRDDGQVTIIGKHHPEGGPYVVLRHSDGRSFSLKFSELASVAAAMLEAIRLLGPKGKSEIPSEEEQE